MQVHSPSLFFFTKLGVQSRSVRLLGAAPIEQAADVETAQALGNSAAFVCWGGTGEVR